MKELKYRKNSKFEIEFTNLDKIKEGDNVVLRLKDGDLTPLIQILYIQGRKHDNNFHIPHIPREPMQSLIKHRDIFNILLHYNSNKIFTFDSFLELECKSIKNVLPKWNIQEDSAVLFLSDEGEGRYAFDLNQRKILSYSVYPDVICEINDKDIKTISLILPELHSEDKSCKYHIENINNVCKELKEKYKVERIELFVSHCFIEANLINALYFAHEFSYDTKEGNFIQDITDWEVFNIDKITTTNSTGILEVQKSDKLEVIDVIEFFKN